jgi:hypothetical protein
LFDGFWLRRVSQARTRGDSFKWPRRKIGKSGGIAKPLTNAGSSLIRKDQEKMHCFRHTYRDFVCDDSSATFGGIPLHSPLS